MLNLILGEYEKAIGGIYKYFDMVYDSKWIVTDFSKAAIKEIDQSEVYGEHLIISPILGGIPPEKLSGGVKTVILLNYIESNKIIELQSCGDNCAKWLLEVGKRRNVTAVLNHIIEFSEPFEIRIENCGKIVHTYDEYLYYMIKNKNKVFAGGTKI